MYSSGVTPAETTASVRAAVRLFTVPLRRPEPGGFGVPFTNGILLSPRYVLHNPACRAGRRGRLRDHHRPRLPATLPVDDYRPTRLANFAPMWFQVVRPSTTENFEGSIFEKSRPASIRSPSMASAPRDRAASASISRRRRLSSE